MDKINNLARKRILVTGSTGFKGSWLCVWLTRMGAEVYGYSLPPEHLRGNFNTCGMDRRIRQVYGDIRSYDDVNKCVDECKPEIVFHLAAQPIVLKSFDEPAETIATNALGTVSILESLRKCETVKSIVVVTTDKCYKNDGSSLVSFTEDCKLGGDDPYSASKACVELIARSYYASFFKKKNVGLATARAGNVVGGGDWTKDRIVPDCIKAIEAGKDIFIRNPSHVRPWQYVLEPLYGYLTLAALMLEDPHKYSEAWNFGPKEDSFITVSEFVKMILLNAESKTGIKLGEETSEKEKKLLAIDSGKAEKVLGVKNLLHISDVARMVSEDYFSIDNPHTHCIRRIYEYELLAGGRNALQNML